MPDVLPTINNEPAQGIQATLDTVYLWNPDVANELIEQINVLLEKLEGVSGTIKPYDELEAPIKQYTPMFYGDGLYVAKEDMDEIPATVDLSQWILVATKATDLTAGEGIVIHDGVISVAQAISQGAAAGATAVQPGDLGTAAYAATTDFATSAQGAKADTALQPGSSVPQYSTMPVASADNLGEIVQYVGAPASGYATGYFYKCVNSDDVYTWENIDVQAEPNIGRFLSLWNCVTGLAETNPPQSPYTYRAGDYFVVGTVSSATPAVNYKPNGSSYVIGTASSTVESGEVYAGDTYFFDGTNWRLQSNTAKTVTFANIAGDIYDNQSAAGALNAKQDALVSGTNIKSINGNSLLGSGDVTLDAKDVGAVPQFSILPEASASNVGDVVQYVGQDTEPSIESVAIEQVSGPEVISLRVNNQEKFIENVQPQDGEVDTFTFTRVTTGVSYTTRVGSLTVSEGGDLFELFSDHGITFDGSYMSGFFMFSDSENCEVRNKTTATGTVWFQTTKTELEAYGFVFTDGPAVSGDNIRYSVSQSPEYTMNGDPVVNLSSYGIVVGTLALNQTVVMQTTYSAAKEERRHGFFYENEASYTTPTATISQTVGSTLSAIRVNLNTFVAQEQPTGSENVNFVASAEIGTYSRRSWTTPNFNASIDANIFVPICEQNGWRYDFMSVGNTNGLEDGYWFFGHNVNEPAVSNLTISELADYGITVTDLDPSASYAAAIFGYTPGNLEWRKGGLSVDISSYGISYSGTPANGDVLTVDYTASTLIGYYWRQKNVQYSDINWVTKVELPSSLGTGTFYPVFTIPGGLSDGLYEFYYQSQRYGESGGVNGLVTYLFRVKVTANGSSGSVSGYVTPVINGQFGGSTVVYPGAYVVSQPTNIGNFVYKNGNNYILYLTSSLFACDTNYQGLAQTIPGAFKLSALKNLTTGEEFVASGEVYAGQSIGNAFYCTVMATPIQDTTPVPSYFLTGDGFISSSNANGFAIYAVGGNQNGFGINYLRVMLSHGQDFYDATLKTFWGNDYELTVNSATGVFTNTQFGYNMQYGFSFFVKLDESINDNVYCIVEWLGKASEERGQNPRVNSGRVSDGYFTEFEPLAIGRLSPKYVGKVLQYTGETNSSYTNGYFYKCVRINASAIATSSNPDVTVSVDVQTFAEQGLESGQYVFEYNAGADEWYDSNSNPVDLADFGISKSGVSISQDTITVDYVAESCDWQRTDVQPAPVIPDPLPSQTGNAGKFLTTDGTDASWATINALVNNTTATKSLAIGTTLNTTQEKAILIGDTLTATPYGSAGKGAVIIGNNINGGNYFHGVCLVPNRGDRLLTESGAVAIGCEANNSNGNGQSIAIGNRAKTSAQWAIQLGSINGTSDTINSDANTFKVANINGNFEIMSADGTVPTDRFTTTPVADGTYVPTVSISSGVATRSWTAPAPTPVVPSTMPELTVADWSNNTQTVTVTGVTSSNIVFVSPAPTSATDFADAGIVCTAQGTDSLTFTCVTVPSNAITVNVIIMG